MEKVLVFFATYNESGNVSSLLESVRRHVPGADVLVVDDNSSDGTAEVIKSLAMPGVHVIVRKGKLGLGTAHLLALAYARHFEYDIVVTMDADLSHDPLHIPMLLEKVQSGFDICIGSRYMPGGSCDYSGYRLYVSKLGNVAARALLGVPIHEFTTSFRALRVARLTEIHWRSLLVGGYSFFLTMIAEVAAHGFRIAEVPIHFHERGYGTSKIPTFEVFRGMANLLRLAAKKTFSSSSSPAYLPTASCSACGTDYSFIREDAQHAGTCVMCAFQRA